MMAMSSIADGRSQWIGHAAAVADQPHRQVVKTEIYGRHLFVAAPRDEVAIV